MVEIHDDIQAMLAQPITNDEDLEEELAELMKNDDNEEDSGKPNTPQIDVKQLEEQLKKLNLPDTPKENPVISESSVAL